MDNANGFVKASVTSVGFADPNGAQGVVVLTAVDGRKLPISAFSGEVAQHIKRFIEGDRTSLPTVYKMVEELAENQSLLLTKIEVYGREGVLRANLFFQGREKNFELTNYRASDSIALAVFYDVDIMLHDEVLAKGAE